VNTGPRMAQAKAVWTSLKVSDLPTKEKLVVIPETTNFSGSIKILAENKILSAPVLNSQGVITGQLDLIDLVVFLVHLAKKSQEVLVALGVIGEHEAINFSDIHVDKQIQDLFQSYDVSQAIANFSKRNPIKVVKSNQPLHDIAVELTQNHRVSVINDSHSIINYITQSDFVKFVFKNKANFYAEKSAKTVTELNLGNLSVVAVHDHDFVIDALKQIAIKGISAVAVVNNEGKIVGDVGAHDVRLVNPGSPAFVESLVMPLKNFLVKASSEGKAPIVVVSPSATLDQVISKMEQNGVHRVYITEDGKPTRVISLGDVIKCLLQ